MKILIIRFSSIGDIVLTTPVIRCLKMQTNAEIHYLTKTKFAAILESNPNIQKVHKLDESFQNTVWNLKNEKFDFIIDLHNSLRSLRFKIALNVKSKSFNKLNIRKWLMVNFKINKLPKIHIVDRYMNAASEFNIVNDYNGLDYFIPDKDFVNVDSELNLEQNNYLAFAIGAQHNTKRLPVDKISDIVKNIDLPVVLLGDKNDFSDAEKVIELSGKSMKMIVNACGLYNLNQSASIVKQSRLLITHDTGLMHIAAALKKTIFSVWGNTIPEFGMYPYLSGKLSQIFESKDVACRPCSKIGFNKCPKKHFKCMNNIDINLMINLVKHI